MTKHDAEFWIERLGLLAHPEGGFYRETYRSAGTISKHGQFCGERSYSTAIYFLLRGGDISKLHRIKSDELWHFHAGDSVEIISIDQSGAFSNRVLGLDLEEGHVPQIVVEAGQWFGARVLEGKTQPRRFCLVGCTVAPGFDFADFEMGKRSDLIQTYPQHRAYIEALT